MLAVGVMAVLLAAFAVVMLEAWRRRVGLWPVMAAVGIVVGAAVAAPVLLSRDVYSYAAYGRILAVHGSNPYLRPPSAFPGDPFVAVASPEWIDARSVYGPGFTLLSEGIARWWSGSPDGTILAFKVVAGVAIAGAAFFASLAARTLRSGRGAAAAAAVGLNPVIVLHTVGGGHNDAIIALFFAGAIALAAGAVRLVGASGQDLPTGWGRRWRAFAVTLLLTLAALVKAVLAPLLVLWFWQLWRAEVAGTGRRAMAAHVGVAAGVSIALFAPVQAGWSMLRALLSVTSRQGWASGAGLVARGADAIGRAVGGQTTGAVFDAAVSVAFAGLFIALFWRVLGRAGAGPNPDDWGGTMLLLALAAPYLLPWYGAWFVPFLGLMRDRVLALAGLSAAALLALTGIPAEAGTAPRVWQDMLLAVHYAAAPVMLALLAVVATRMVRAEPACGSPTSP
jgi:alpha-1,6-mannosyltransferase